MTKKRLISIVGPTAVGKTKLAIEIAKAFNSEIISADSRQFYREMNIGTAKPGEDELKQVTHHFINSHSISEDLSAGDYERQAITLLQDLFNTGTENLVLVGGSGLYINAVLYGLDDLPKDPVIKNRLIKEFEANGLINLNEELKAKDPEYYELVDLSNPVRVIRALEVINTSGNKYSSLRNSEIKPRNFDNIIIGLELPRKELYDRINRRVDNMINSGLENEALLLSPYQNKNSLKTVGYKEWFAFFNEERTRDETISLIKRNSRRYAKRQLTWFKKKPDIRWFRPRESDQIIQYISSIINRA